MKILDIVVLLALSAIAEGQWAAAARGIYQPIVLSVGTVFAAMNIKSQDDSFSWQRFVANFESKETQSKEEDKIEDKRGKGFITKENIEEERLKDPSEQKTYHINVKKEKAVPWEELEDKYMDNFVKGFIGDDTDMEDLIANAN